MKLSSIAAAIALGLVVCTQASAVVIDFNAQPDVFSAPEPITAQGFTFSGLDGGLLGLSNSRPYQSDDVTPTVFNGSRYLLAGFGGLAIAATDGSSFVLNGWDLALGWFQSVTPNTVTATFTLAAGGEVTQSLTLHTNSFSSTSFGQAVTRITLTSGNAPGNTFASGYISLDNLNVSAVPEPTSLALMLAGLGLVGNAARRSRRSA